MAVTACAAVSPVRSPLRPISELPARLEVAAPRTRRGLFPAAGLGGAELDPRGLQGARTSRGQRPAGLQFVFVPVLLTHF